MSHVWFGDVFLMECWLTVHGQNGQRPMAHGRVEQKGQGGPQAPLSDLKENGLELAGVVNV